MKHIISFENIKTWSFQFYTKITRTHILACAYNVNQQYKSQAKKEAIHLSFFGRVILIKVAENLKYFMD